MKTLLKFFQSFLKSGKTTPNIILNKTFSDTFIKGLLDHYNIKEATQEKYIHWLEICGDYNRMPSSDFYNGSFIKYIDDNTITDIKNNKAILVVSTFQETFSPTDDYPIPEYLDVDLIIERECTKHNIPLDNVLWLSGDLNVEQRKKSNISCYGFSCYSHEFLYMLNKRIKITPFHKRKFIKDYVCFNRWMKPGRVYLLTELVNQLVDVNGFISCPDSMFGDTFKSRSKLLVDRLIDHSAYWSKHEIDIDRVKEIVSKINKTVPWELDVTDFENNFCAGEDTLHTSKRYYEQSFCSLISESQIEGSALYISEAAYRPFLYGHPAIWVGQPGIVKELQNMGFKTWDWLLDESYDNEVYTADRIKKCVKSLVNLINSPKSNEVLRKIHKQNQYNFKVLQKQSVEYQKEKLLNILNSKIQH